MLWENILNILCGIVCQSHRRIRNSCTPWCHRTAHQPWHVIGCPADSFQQTLSIGVWRKCLQMSGDMATDSSNISWLPSVLTFHGQLYCSKWQTYQAYWPSELADMQQGHQQRSGKKPFRLLYKVLSREVWLNYAWNYRDWSAEEWQQVLQTDKSNF